LLDGAEACVIGVPVLGYNRSYCRGSQQSDAQGHHWGAVAEDVSSEFCDLEGVEEGGGCCREVSGGVGVGGGDSAKAEAMEIRSYDVACLREEGNEVTAVAGGGEAVKEEDGGSGWSTGGVVKGVEIDGCRH
jgi:hypothetical protein